MQAIWHAPATAEEQELSALEKEPTAGMLFVRIVELDLQDAPEHMPVSPRVKSHFINVPHLHAREGRLLAALL